MLHQLTWHECITAVIFLAIVYYLILAFRYYRPELQKLISRMGHQESEGHLPAALRYGGKEEVSYAVPKSTAVIPSPKDSESRTYEIPTDTDHLELELKACISIAADKPFAPDALILQLKKIIQGYPGLTGSPHRPTINAFIVKECEKTGTALLTEDGVDLWWR